MKRLLFAFIAILSAFPALAQPSARPITPDRMIPAYEIEVTFGKTTHLIFPAPIVYVDLGSADIIAGKADGAENVLRVKAAVRSFEGETNLAVITECGLFYSFTIRYADEPQMLNIEMKDFLHDGEAVNRPNNSLDIYLSELGSESPRTVNLITKKIYQRNKRHVRGIGSDRFGIRYRLRGLYAHENLIYLHLQLENESNVPFDVDFVRMKIVDKKVAKRTAIQETVIEPIRAYNHVRRVGGKQTERTVLAIDKITIPDDKLLVVELFEKHGGRHQKFVIKNSDLIRARVIDDLK